jgi:hypothetical protein
MTRAPLTTRRYSGSPIPPTAAGGDDDTENPRSDPDAAIPTAATPMETSASQTAAENEEAAPTSS